MNAARILGSLCPLVALLALAVPVLLTLQNRRKAPMTFHYTDPDGDHLFVEPVRRYGRPSISLRNQPAGNGQGAAVHIPVDQVEELVAGLRDTARRATTRP